ncbi:MAG: hypothetical protein M1833_003510 [Piccolia ochrophora]|nr:MAG: hypothetical protein M1833_003510 [Piccolia ochrophora]
MTTRSNGDNKSASAQDTNIEVNDDKNIKADYAQKCQTMEWLARSSALCALTSFVYFALRVKYTLGAPSESVGRETLVAWGFLIVEGALALNRNLSFLLSLATTGKARIRPSLRLHGGQVPTIDLFILHCGEGVELVLDTIRAACALDYPSDRYRIITLDDGRSSDLAKAVEEVGELHANVHYTTRDLKVSTHSKAANLNHGLQYVKTLQGGPSEYVSVLDVDMIPEPQTFRALLPHVLKDPKVALANAPQSFYNVAKHDPLINGYYIWYLRDIICHLKDALDASWCMGSGYVARRSALDQIGGIPTEGMQEDIMTSFYLTTAGWKIAYVPERLQWGLVPDSYAGTLKQVQRWTAGCFQASAAILAAPAGVATWAQRFDGAMVGIFYALEVFTLTFCMVVIPTMLLSGSPLILYSTPSHLRLLIRIGCIDTAAQALNGLFTSRMTGYRLAIFSQFSNLWTAPYLLSTASRYVLAAISTSLASAIPNYTPSGSLTDGSHERDARRSGSPLTRLRVIMWNPFSLFLLLVLSACTLSAALELRAVATAALAGPGLVSALRHTLVRAAYPPAFLLWTAVLGAASVPLSYALFPPPVVVRERLLARDPRTKVAYPTEQAKTADDANGSHAHAVAVVSVLVGAFVGSWWL